jgi:L-lactate dehydrogenase complex protein LldG
MVENSLAAGTIVYQCSVIDLNATIIEAASKFPQGPLIIADHDYFNRAGTAEALQQRFDTVDRWERSLSREENIAKAEQASVGIVKAELALAESATVVLFSHQGAGRSVSLLPTYTVTVIEQKSIRPRLTQAMSFLREIGTGELPSSVNLISGASSTADIELVRVQGVHGPLATAYVIVS